MFEGRHNIKNCTKGSQHQEGCEPLQRYLWKYLQPHVSSNILLGCLPFRCCARASPQGSPAFRHPCLTLDPVTSLWKQHEISNKVSHSHHSNQLTKQSTAFSPEEAANHCTTVSVPTQQSRTKVTISHEIKLTGNCEKLRLYLFFTY